MDLGNVFLFELNHLIYYIFIFLYDWNSASVRTEIPLPTCWIILLAWASMIPWCSSFQVFLHQLLNTAIVKVLGSSGGVRSLMVSFYPRTLIFNIYIGEMRLPPL